MQRDELNAYLETALECARFRDYCPNGLQVEGRPEIHRIVCGVTASQALLDAAVARQADAVLVHHGYFWKGEDGRIAGIRKARLATLLKHDINLFAYHLPLDAHEIWGNNAQWAARLGWQVKGRFGDQSVGFVGTLSAPATARGVADAVSALTGRPAQLVGDATRPVRRVAWCSGGAQGYFEEAIALDADLYVSGEISEQTYHLAVETGVPFLAAGHHATERYGVQALAAHLSGEFGLECDYVEIDNPV